MDQALSTIVTSSEIDVLILGWLDAKARKSNSEKTFTAYRDTLQQFRAGLQREGLDLDSQEKEALAKIALLAQAYAGGSLVGKQVRPATFNQRLAILSSFYSYAIRQGVLSINPIARVERAKVQAYAGAQPLETDTTSAALSAIDRSTPSGKRDYALLAILLQTGRRLTEVVELKIEHLTEQSGKIKLHFVNCKGGKEMFDLLPHAASHALMDWLRAYYGQDLTVGTHGDARPVWVSLANRTRDQPLGPQSISDICKKHLGTSKVHATRHTYAIEMEKAGASPATIQARLGHESLATTGKYLHSLKRADNPYADQVGANLGIR